MLKQRNLEHATRDFMSPLQGLKKILGDIIPRFVCFYVKILDSCLRRNDREGTRRKMDSLSRLFVWLRVLPAQERQVFVFTRKYWIPAFAGMTEREQGGRWIRYHGSSLRFVSCLRRNGRFLFLHENTGFPLSRE